MRGFNSTLGTDTFTMQNENQFLLMRWEIWIR